ncbi:OLC1v1036862C1 [Oldenlandia corymbosa var. corymbosa]|uniref:tyrosine--tRNA ligase n=1 Tax=Oldenlandia corymbosa var. corymbosa TaxID=529605 RepID=A0AAV1CWC0_OLDCO|nr:OLC1v1036862C1 [Oldenlandia corymbosa var. corymbosa]
MDKNSAVQPDNILALQYLKLEDGGGDPRENFPTVQTRRQETGSSSSCSSMSLTVEEKFRIIKSIAEELTVEDELLTLLSNKPNPICYDRFEPSGRMHIAQGVMEVRSLFPCKRPVNQPVKHPR